MRLYSKLQHSTLFLSILMSIFFCQTATASDEIERAGNIGQYLIPAIAYSTTFYFDDPEGREQFYKSFFTNLAITYGSKNLIEKKRPNGSDQSFPSGHTSAAFQGATFIHKRYGLKPAIPAYLGASFVGYSRIESDSHHLEDVIVGAVIGSMSSFYFTKSYKGFSITPTANNHTYGLSVTKRW